MIRVLKIREASNETIVFFFHYIFFKISKTFRKQTPFSRLLVRKIKLLLTKVRAVQIGLLEAPYRPGELETLSKQKIRFGAK